MTKKIWYGFWGCNGSRQIDFYVEEKRTEKTVTLRRIGTNLEHLHTEGFEVTWLATPNPEQDRKVTIRRKLKTTEDGETYVDINNFTWAFEYREGMRLTRVQLG